MSNSSARSKAWLSRLAAPVQQANHLTTAQLESAELQVLEHVSVEELQRCIEPRHLVDRGRAASTLRRAAGAICSG